MNIFEGFWVWLEASRMSSDPVVKRDADKNGWLWHELRNSGHLKGLERLDLYRRLRTELWRREAEKVEKG